MGKRIGFIDSRNEKIGIDWYIHGNAAMALCGIDVKHKKMNIIIPNYSDYDIVRNHFYKFTINPFERCDNWVTSGLGNIFLQANTGFAFHNSEFEPYDIRKHYKLPYKGENIYISTLEMLKEDNKYFGRPKRVALINKQIAQ